MLILKILRTGRSILDFYHRLTAYIAAIVIASITLIIVVEVVLRSMFNRSIPILLQLCAVIFPIITFIVAPWVLRHASHITVTFMVDKLGVRSRRAVNLFVLTGSVFLSALLAHLLISHGTRIWARGDMLDPPLRLLNGPFYIVLAASCGILALEYMILLLKEARSMLTKDSATKTL